MISPEKIAWAAGIFEGEGCICKVKKQKHSWHLAIAMSDLDVLEEIKNILGGIIYKDREKPFRKQMWIWRLHKAILVERTLKQLLPWLKTRRGHKALIALNDLAQHRDIKRKTECKNGHPWTKENIYIHPTLFTGQKNFGLTCRICKQLAVKRYTARKRVERAVA